MQSWVFSLNHFTQTIKKSHSIRMGFFVWLCVKETVYFEKLKVQVNLLSSAPNSFAAALLTLISKPEF